MKVTDDFLMRTISAESSDGKMYAFRTRNSNGFASITIRVMGKEIQFTNEEGNDAYEQQALELARLIEGIATNPCFLPDQK
jgi:hypothetical protein